MNLDQQQFQQQQQQQQRGILPAQILNALDILVDRLNASSGYSFSGGGGTFISGAPLPLNNTVADSDVNAAATAGDAPPQSLINPVQSRVLSSSSSPPIKALLVGTNEGVGLSRSIGTDDSGNFFHSMSEEILSTIETVWATLPSAVPPHIMASVASSLSSSSSTPNGTTPEEDPNNNNPNHHQPPHSLLSPLQMGSIVKTTTAIYSNCIVMHIHYPPLVVTLLMSPEVNLGAVRNVLFDGVELAEEDRTVVLGKDTKKKKQGILEVLLEPVRRALVRCRCGVMGSSGGTTTAPGMGSGIGGGSGGGGGMIGEMSNTTKDNGRMMTMSLQQQQAMTFLQQQQQQLQLQTVQNVMPMDPYQQQQMLHQQQMMMTQQHQY